MAELEYLMAARKVYGHRSRPASPKASSHRTSLPTPHIRNIFARSLENAISNTREHHTDGGQPIGTQCVLGEEVLAAHAGQAPADPAEGRKQKALCRISFCH